MNKTELWSCHNNLGASMASFAGYSMPMHYGSQLNEHHAVRKDAGVFDVSHMRVLEFKGIDTEDFLSFVLASDIRKTKPGQAQYNLLLNFQGGIIDDLIVYNISQSHYRLVVNASRYNIDKRWLEQQKDRWPNGRNITIEALDVSILALQGPKALSYLTKTHPAWADAVSTLKPFEWVIRDGWQIATTGYTGEWGVEWIIPLDKTVAVWQSLVDAGVTPCGLGARDTLRLEAGYNLYGQDMDEHNFPSESRLSWVVDLERERDFLGKQALLDKKSKNDIDNNQRLVSIRLLDKGILRSGYTVITDSGEGVITSGSYSPTLDCGIGFARVPAPLSPNNIKVLVRNRELKADISHGAFVKFGQDIYKPLS